LKITQELRAFAIEQADKRCECAGKNCRHHLKGARCKRGLRGDQWKVFWRREDGGASRDNIEAWCLECFANNFRIPSESVAILALDVVGYRRLLAEDRWRAITLKSALRDAARRAAGEHGGSIVLNRADDDIVLDFPTCLPAIEAVRALRSHFRDLVLRLNIDVPDISGAIHCGEVVRWRNGLLIGEAVDVATKVRDRAGLGQLFLTKPAAESVAGQIELEPVATGTEGGDGAEAVWALRL
jgi:class 3 adenylate cyclase